MQSETLSSSCHFDALLSLNYKRLFAPITCQFSHPPPQSLLNPVQTQMLHWKRRTWQSLFYLVLICPTSCISPNRKWWRKLFSGGEELPLQTVLRSYFIPHSTQGSHQAVVRGPWGTRGTRSTWSVLCKVSTLSWYRNNFFLRGRKILCYTEQTFGLLSQGKLHLHSMFFHVFQMWRSAGPRSTSSSHNS